jgi:hypothetical protein
MRTTKLDRHLPRDSREGDYPEPQADYQLFTPSRRPKKCSQITVRDDDSSLHPEPLQKHSMFLVRDARAIAWLCAARAMQQRTTVCDGQESWAAPNAADRVDAC